MADAEAPQEVAPKKSKKPLMIGVLLALVLGGGGFFAAYSGMILGSHPAGESVAQDAASPLPDIAFVPVDPLIITLGSSQSGRNLRFSSQIEVAKAYAADVALLMPRIVDVMNGYLRAIDPAELDDPAMLLRIRAQLLRRIQMVTGDGRVRDLLVTEFVLN
ncbi:MAG: flagellar basal body-associated FliL family protein [Cypionkella sp.]|nr:flagellar basal body-associated FliL family protein [Cypionkella sp.]